MINVAFYRIKNKKWIFKAVDRKPRKTIAWITGNCDVATFRKLYNKIKQLKKSKFLQIDGLVSRKFYQKRGTLRAITYFYNRTKQFKYQALFS